MQSPTRSRTRFRPRTRTALPACFLLGGALAAILGGGCARDTPALLVLITTDTLRADHVGAYGGVGRALSLTPRLDALAGQSLRFERAYAPASYTLPSIAALMTGRYPEELGIFANRSMFRGSSVTLAEILRLQGWKTGAVVSNYVLRRGTGIEVGFDLYDDAFTQSEANRKQPEREAERTTDAALALFEQLRAAPAPGHFLWVHYQDPHGPYLPPEGDRERFLEASLAAQDGRRELPSLGINPIGAIPSYQFVDDEHRVGYYRAGYAGEINYTDREIGRLLDGLGDRASLGDAIVVFTADHGESLGEDDYWFAHGEHLSEVLVRVPLWIKAPGLAAGTRKDVTSLVDLFPTLLTLVSVEVPGARAGRDLLDDASQADARAYMATLLGSSTARRGVVFDDYHYVASELPGGRVGERIDRTDGRELDPEGADREALGGMREALETARSALRAPRAEELQSLTPDDREMLRRLGYVE